MSEYAYDARNTETAASPDRKAGIVDEFAGSTDALRFEIDRLFEQLSSVLKPDFDSEKVTASSMPPQPVQSAVRDTHNQLAGQIRRLEHLRSRLEV